MFIDEWVKIEYTKQNGAGSLIAKVIRSDNIGISFLMSSTAESYLYMEYVVSITRVDEDTIQEYQTEYNMNLAGFKLEAVANRVIEVFDSIIETLPCDYDDLIEQLASQITTKQLKDLPAKG